MFKLSVNYIFVKETREVLEKNAYMVLLFYMRLKFTGRLIMRLCLTLLINSFLSAEDNQALSAPVFINSNPINAGIILDGEPTLQKTPALLTDIRGGRHTLKIIKDGFEDREYTFETSGEQTSVIDLQLTSGTVVADFPEESRVYIRKSKDASEDLRRNRTVRLPEGRYDIKNENGEVIVIPVYPKQTLLTMNTAVFFTAVAANLTAIKSELDRFDELSFPHSPALTVSEAAVIITGLTEIALLRDKQYFLDDFRIYNAGLEELESEAEKIFAEAQDQLSRGRLENALTGFTRIISEFPDSPRFPEALYKVARIHIISADTNLAVSELNIIIDHFPEADIYDKACQTLALLYFNSGKPGKAADTVNRMVFYDPLFAETREDIEQFGAEKVVENWAGNPEGGNQ